jgi:hypothetical protein
MKFDVILKYKIHNIEAGRVFRPIYTDSLSTGTMWNERRPVVLATSSSSRALVRLVGGGWGALPAPPCSSLLLQSRASPPACVCTRVLLLFANFIVVLVSTLIAVTSLPSQNYYEYEDFFLFSTCYAKGEYCCLHNYYACFIVYSSIVTRSFYCCGQLYNLYNFIFIIIRLL